MRPSSREQRAARARRSHGKHATGQRSGGRGWEQRTRRLRLSTRPRIARCQAKAARAVDTAPAWRRLAGRRPGRCGCGMLSQFAAPLCHAYARRHQDEGQLCGAARGGSRPEGRLNALRPQDWRLAALVAPLAHSVRAHSGAAQAAAAQWCLGWRPRAARRAGEPCAAHTAKLMGRMRGCTAEHPPRRLLPPFPSCPAPSHPPAAAFPAG